MVERAKYLDKLSTDEYKQLTRKRNAIEGIPSVLRRRYHVDDIPVFGYLRSRQFFLFKIGAYNFNKLLKHNRRTRGSLPKIWQLPEKYVKDTSIYTAKSV